MLTAIKQRILADWKRLNTLLANYQREVAFYGQRQGNIGANATIRMFYSSEITRLRNAGATAQQVQPLVNAQEASRNASKAQSGALTKHLNNAINIRNQIDGLAKQIAKEYASFVSQNNADLSAQAKQILAKASARVTAANKHAKATDIAALARVTAANKHAKATDIAALARVTAANSRVAKEEKLALTAFNGLPHKIVFSRSIPITGDTTAQPSKPINAALVGIASGSLVGGIPGALLGGVIGYLIKRSKHE